MALAGFFDLSILPDDSKSTTTNTSIIARALDLGYSAVALDHPHRGLLADSHAPIASSLLLPPSASLHHRRHPFLQYTRITLSLDSAAACASALAPSAARLLRTYDIVAARPLTQAAFDHLCQATFDHLDIVSIDFSHKLPFRLKLPMLKLALQRGLHLEIAYSPLIADAASRRQAVAEAKLLVEWTKGKNLIISSAAHTASEIRGPYDAINLSSYLLGLSTQRAKAALSVNCRGESLMTCVLSTLPASCEQHSVATNLDNPGNNETVMAHDVQTAAVSSFDLKGIEKHVESLHDAMELDGTESSKINLIADFTAPLSSDDSLVCYAIPCSMELSDTSVVNKCPHQSTGFPDYAKACTECDSGLTSCERVDRISQDHDILSGSSIYSKNKDLYSYSDISVFSETHKDFAEPLELPPCGKDDEAPPDLAAQLHCNSCKDVMMPPQVISDEVEPVDRGATILVEHTPCGPETALTAFLYDKGSIDTTSKTDELAKQNSNSLEGDVAKIHEQLLNYSYASGEVEISLTRSEKRTKKLRSQHPIYVPFLGFLKSVSFKKKASKQSGRA
uniref:RNase P subunit p30 family protein n=1 Tax=Oryza rufipogon TaxID=4529 RepID=A0A0E0RCG5_ORYRU